MPKTKSAQIQNAGDNVCQKMATRSISTHIPESIFVSRKKQKLPVKIQLRRGRRLKKMASQVDGPEPPPLPLKLPGAVDNSYVLVCPANSVFLFCSTVTLTKKCARSRDQSALGVLPNLCSFCHRERRVRERRFTGPRQVDRPSRRQQLGPRPQP